MNGLNMYYEIHRAGRPLVLLHGGRSTIDVDFGRVLPRFAEARQVIMAGSPLSGGVAGDIPGLPSSRLAVLPGTTRITLITRADWLVSMMTEFLEG